ncbi:hypothetical protein [Listeria fleischmannii]|uniref:Uncharacterized protein n=1 Tax=Listeria fleischmannii FSL S10-1203 TaxID=1265822 RepID=W7D709_9LIST|nr:hypothetical protein [Listeria fleischmannii]EUJ44850.1 hypothetical protein MCOL2_19619 [Listeria fleischmannii FSL S10-1203]
MRHYRLQPRLEVLFFQKKLAESGHKVTVITTDAFMKQEKPYKMTNDVKYFHIEGIEILAIRSDYSNFLGKKARIMEFLKFMRKAEHVGKKIKKSRFDFCHLNAAYNWYSSHAVK